MKKILLSLLVAAILAVGSCSDESDDALSKKATSCFNLSSESPLIGEEILFSNCSNNATHFYWDFGNFEYSTAKEPRHTYLIAGQYKIVLLAGNDINGDGKLDAQDKPASFTKNLVVDPIQIPVKILVRDATSWTVNSLQCSPVAGALVKLYASQSAFDSGKPTFSLTTDAKGEVSFPVIFNDLSSMGISFMVVAGKGDLSNIKDGYVIQGVFNTQEEVDNHCYQAGAKVGSMKFKDMNCDGVISEDDKAPYDNLSYHAVYVVAGEVATIYIGK
jgi:hypothetical protein